MFPTIDHPSHTVAAPAPSAIQAPAASVPAEPSPRTAAAHDTVSRAFLFTDIVGSTDLNERLGDRRFAALVAQHNAVVREAARRFDAAETVFLGDGFLLVLPHTRAALRCAAAIQQGMAELRERHGVPLRVRLGANAGAALREGDTFVGRNVTLARRLCEHARADEVLVTDRMRSTAGSLASRLGAPLPRFLKGIQAPEPSCALDWR